MRLVRQGIMLLIIFSLLPLGALPLRAQSALTWWLTGSTIKISPDEAPPADPAAALHLHAARQEYAPFQAVFRAAEGGAAFPLPQLDYPADLFAVTVFAEQFVRFPVEPSRDVFTFEYLDAPALPDGLFPAGETIEVPANGVAVLWVDVLVKAGTPPGDYALTLNAGDAGTRSITLTVYPLDLPQEASMSVIIPEEVNWTIPYYAPGGDAAAFHLALNDVLLQARLIPGSFQAVPVYANGGWDFSSLDAEIDELPPQAYFYTPIPYDEANEIYLLLDDEGSPYEETAFDDPYFVQQAQGFFNALAAYLQAKGRLEYALVYPVDETRWVADEPDHNGPAGYARLAQWTALVRAAGLRVTASRVLPVPFGATEFGWPDSATVTNDTHVPMDFFDANPQLYATWSATPGFSASIYLNHFGDLIDLPAAVHRATIWHAYGRGVRVLAGYAALEWLTERFDLIDPLAENDQLYPHFGGYGIGALVWPTASGPLPSLRLMVLREGIEDVRLLDLYAAVTSPEAARALAACMTPGALADQSPAPDQFEMVHTALLTALAGGQPLDPGALCLPLPGYAETQDVFDFDSSGADLDSWDLAETEAELVPSPFNTGEALQVAFDGDLPSAGYWLGGVNWDGWTALQVDVQNVSPYYASVDFGLSDNQDHYLLLRGSSVLIGPNSTQTLTLPLREPLDYGADFAFGSVGYLNMEVATVWETEDYTDTPVVWPLGGRTLVFDNFRLVR